jgi:tungstate transport system substrate-binding protein
MASWCSKDLWHGDRIKLTATLVAIALASLALDWQPATTQEKYIIVQSTTSTDNSGLFKHLLPLFTRKTGIAVRVVAVGTGQALKNAQNGDGDVVLVHSKADEERFVAEGWGVKRYDLMYNDFIVVGPPQDPAGISGGRNAVAAFSKIAAAKAPFVSRGDDSGTHKAESELWRQAGVAVKAASGGWYRETGQGMGATLNTAVGMGAYVLTDRATWSSFRNRGDFRIAVEGDQRLYNQYGVILVNPAKHPRVKADLAQQFVDWLVSDEGQDAIRAFRINGEQQFFPNARPAG